MKITNNGIGNTTAKVDSGKLSKTESAGAQGLKNGVSASNSANVNVSERAQMMQKAKELASGPMTVDEAKVARLQKMIDEGKYKVDANSVADRLVEEHLSIPD